MKPEKKELKYEKIKTSDLVNGQIEEIQYDPEHKFSFKGETKKASGVRFKFLIEECKYSHYSRWMKFNYAEKSSLYQKYLVPLVENAKPYMDFDLDHLLGLKVKMLWIDKGDFQELSTIIPSEGKVKFTSEHADKVPF